MRYTKYLVGLLTTLSLATAFADEPTPTDLTDGQVAHVILTGDAAGIAVNQLTAERGSNADVKAFAESMVTEYRKHAEALTALLTKLEIVPENSDLAQSIIDKSVKDVDALKNLRGAEFDIAFMDKQIECHNMALGMLYHDLLQTTDHLDLRGFILDTIAAMSTHLKQAETIRKSLGK